MTSSTKHRNFFIENDHRPYDHGFVDEAGQPLQRAAGDPANDDIAQPMDDEHSADHALGEEDDSGEFAPLPSAEQSDFPRHDSGWDSIKPSVTDAVDDLVAQATIGDGAPESRVGVAGEASAEETDKTDRSEQWPQEGVHLAASTPGDEDQIATGRQDDEEAGGDDDSVGLSVSRRDGALIYVDDSDLDRVHRQIESALAATGRYFVRAGSLVRVDRNADGGTTLAEVRLPELKRELSTLVAFAQTSSAEGEPRLVAPPSGLCKEFLDLRHYPQLLPVVGLANAPFLRLDGSLCREGGLDVQSGLYGTFDASAFPVPAQPTMDDAQKAMEALCELVAEFAFADVSQDTSAALAAMLTAAIRPSLPLAPMFVVTAPAAGTGKTMLCELIAQLATAQGPAIYALPRTDSEADRALHAILGAGPAAVLFDNIYGEIPPHDKLCTALTSEWCSGRRLRSSITERFSTRVLFLATGNNVKPHRDMSRRCVLIRLDAKVDRPASRAFRRPDLLREAREQRAQIVAHALTIIEAFNLAGCPGADALLPLGSYQQWSRWCRAPLVWLGQPDPAAGVFKAMDYDPDHQQLKALLQAWDALFADKPTRVRDVFSRPEFITGDDESIRGVIDDICGGGRDMRRVFGRWLDQHKGVRAGGLTLMPVPGIYNSLRWRVIRVA